MVPSVSGDPDEAVLEAAAPQADHLAGNQIFAFCVEGCVIKFSILKLFT